MRFVAKYQKYAMQVRPQREIVTIDGIPMVAQEQIVVEFEQGALRPHEIDAGVAELGARRGLPDGLDPSYRLSVLDTEWWQKAFGTSEADREQVEQHLLNSPSLNVDYILVDTPRVPAPWPRYDEFKDARKLAAKVVEDGFDIEDVIGYETQNQNRTEVITALEEARAASTLNKAEEVLA